MSFYDDIMKEKKKEKKTETFYDRITSKDDVSPYEMDARRNELQASGFSMQKPSSANIFDETLSSISRPSTPFLPQNEPQISADIKRREQYPTSLKKKSLFTDTIVPPVAAFTNKVLDSASLGLLPLTLEKIAPSVQSTRERMYEESPTAAALGSAAGYLVPGIGAEKLAVKAFPSVYKGLKGATDIAARGIGSGALLGATEGLTEGIKDNLGISGTLSNMASKEYGLAAAGGIGGALLGSIGKGISKLTNKFSPTNRALTNIDNAMERYANEGISARPSSNIPLSPSKNIPSLNNRLNPIENVTPQSNIKPSNDVGSMNLRPNNQNALEGQLSTKSNELPKINFDYIKTIEDLPNDAANLEAYIKDVKMKQENGMIIQPIDLQLFAEAQAKLERIKTGQYTRIDTTNKKMNQLDSERNLTYDVPEKMPSTLNDVVPSFKKEQLSFKDVKNKLYTRLVDTKHPIKLADEATYKQAMVNGNAQGTVNHILKDANVGMEGNKIGESFGNIYRDIGKIKQKATTPQGETKIKDPSTGKIRDMNIEDAFNQYLLHKHNVDTMSIKDSSVADAIERDLQQLEQQRMNVTDAAEFKTINNQIKRLESMKGLTEQSQKEIFGSNPHTAEMSDKIAKWYEQKYPEFKGISERLNKEYSKFMDEWAVNSGLIDQDSMKIMREMYPNYVPKNRFFDEIEKLTPKGISSGSYFNKNNLIQKFTGSGRKIINPLESILKNIDKTVKAARSNEVGQKLVEAIRNNPQAMQLKGAKLIEPTQQMMDELNVVMREEGVEGLNDFIGSQFDRALSRNLKGSNIVTVMENGSPTFVQIDNLDLLKSMKGLTESKKGLPEQIARAITNPFKTVVTGKNPIFGLKNFVRDVPNAYINSIANNPLKFGRDLVTAAKEMATNGKLWQEYKALGGEHSNFFSDNGKKLMKQKNQLVNGKSILQKTGDALGGFNNATESVNRFAEYIRTVREGGGSYQSKMDGIYNAAEISTNFGRHGDITKAIDSFVPYLNPAVQGLDKFARQAISQPGKTIPKSLARTAIKGTIGVTGITALLGYINKDDPNYQALDNRTKDTNYLIPTGDGTFVKFPKTRENGVIFGSLLERIGRMLKGEQDSFKGFGETLKTNFLPPNPIDSNFASPIVTNLPSNKDFAGRSIEPLYMQDRQKRDRYDDKTSYIAKAVAPLAEKLNLSPVQLDYLIRSYSGIIGQIGLPATTQDASMGNVLIGGFKADPLRNNQSVQDFYENKDKLKLQAGSKNFNENIPSKKVTNEESFRNAFDRASTHVSDLTKKINKTTNQDEIKLLRKQLIDITSNMNKALSSNDLKLLNKTEASIKKLKK